MNRILRVLRCMLDGSLVENSQPSPVAKSTSIDDRRVDLFHRYQLPDAAHTVVLKWLNPRTDAQVYLGEAVIYSSQPNQLTYK